MSKGLTALEFKDLLRRRQYAIGVDPGTHTGLSFYDLRTKKLQSVETDGIISAMETALNYSDTAVLVVEDARTRGGSKETMLGAGSIRRDCSIWQEFADYYNMPIFWKATPRGKVRTTKLTAEQFKALTGWGARTSNHARDAAMLVYGY